MPSGASSGAFISLHLHLASAGLELITVRICGGDFDWVVLDEIGTFLFLCRDRGVLNGVAAAACGDIGVLDVILACCGVDDLSF